MANLVTTACHPVLGEDWEMLKSEQVQLQARSEHIQMQLDAACCVEQMLGIARTFYQLTGRQLQTYGDLGELYAVAKFGVILHKKRNVAGSDGKMGNHFVEVKTITPAKTAASVRVKRNGNFGKLLIVRVFENFTIEGKMVAKSDLPKGDGDMVTVAWPA
ncbi:hypothetical protein [uncultured Litoreibacter sp.]|uniref:hypothetical protein n=1 Tax=uncultured Litoreibacter sp. TaxID=1392394 RepID=UPI002633407A|nr:hypothetical protein [uncultured Litoreibacter sp.]